jgi:hypothetical protein
MTFRHEVINYDEGVIDYTSPNGEQTAGFRHHFFPTAALAEMWREARPHCRTAYQYRDWHPSIEAKSLIERH